MKEGASDQEYKVVMKPLDIVSAHMSNKQSLKKYIHDNNKEFLKFYFEKRITAKMGRPAACRKLCKIGS